MSLNISAVNAAKIALYCQRDGTATNQCDQIVMAADRLKGIELRHGFDWTHYKNDWEATCVWIATQLNTTGRVPSVDAMLAYITQS